MSSLPRAVLYARVSTEEQGRGYSIPTQLEAMRRYCEQRGYQVVGEYTDTHSGTEIDRPGINALIDDLPQLKPDVVVLYDVDRLGREVIVQAILERELTALGARVEYVLGGDTETPDGELLKMFKGALAVWDNRQRSERVRRGKRGRAQAGYVTVSKPPYGYRYVSEPHKGWLEIDEERAAVVRRIYAMLVNERATLYRIARELDATGAPLPTGSRASRTWRPDTVYRIVTNPVYKGQWAYGKTRQHRKNGKYRTVKLPPDQWVTVPVPAIVDEATWDAAQQTLRENAALSWRRAKTREYLLSGLVFCACGYRRVAQYDRRAGCAWYRCHASVPAQTWYDRPCTLGQIAQPTLDAVVWDYIVGRLLSPEVLRVQVEHEVARVREEAEKRERRLRAVESAIAARDRKLGELLRKELDGYPAAVVEAEKRRLLAERQQLEGERDRLLAERQASAAPVDVEALTALAETVRAALPVMTTEERRQLLRVLRVRVDVLDEQTVRVSGILGEQVLALTRGDSIALSSVRSKMATPVVSLPVPAVVGMAIIGLSGPGTGRPSPIGGLT